MQEQSHGHFHFQARIPLANKIFNIFKRTKPFADFAKCNKSADWADSAVAMLSQLVAMRYAFYGQAQDTCAVCLLFLVTVQ